MGNLIIYLFVFDIVNEGLSYAILKNSIYHFGVFIYEMLWG